MSTNNYGYNDWRNYLQHNWGNSPKMKAAEKKYNAEYYQQHKAKILAAAKERASDIAEDWASKNGAVSKEYAERQKRRMDEYANGKTEDQLKNDYEYNSRKRSYEGQLEAYYKTPLGKLERAASAGRSAMEKASNRVNRVKSAFKPLSKETKARMDARANEMKKSGKTLSVSIGGKEAISIKKKKRSGSLVDRAIDRAKETGKKVRRK